MSETFAFTEENMQLAQDAIAKYPASGKASAVMPLLHLAQKQNGGFLNRSAMDYIAQTLEMPAVKVYEVASFYSMYNLEPVGKYCVNVCSTTPCWLRGSNEILKACEQELGVQAGHTTEDKLFTLRKIECLCACANAPVVQINDDYYEDLTPESIVGVLKQLKAGKKPKTGSQIGRISSEPIEE